MKDRTENKTGNINIKGKYFSAFALAPLPAAILFSIVFYIYFITNSNYFYRLHHIFDMEKVKFFIYIMTLLVNLIFLIILTYIEMLITWFFCYILLKKSSFYKLKTYIYTSFITGFIISVLISIYKYEPENILHFMFILVAIILYNLSVFINFWRKSMYKQKEEDFYFFKLFLNLLFKW